MGLLYTLMNIYTKEYICSSDGRVLSWIKYVNCLEYKCENRISTDYMICSHYNGKDYVIVDKEELLIND